ncbi:MAG TPA: hypothetical protein GX736_03070 [Mogibacterium sp.]|nr:hypothetical protein [Mogibacterium sp.]
MNESGWTRSDTLEKLRHARETNGVSTKLYYAYRFWELSEEEQATYFTNGIGRELSEKYSEEFVINRMMFYHKNFFLDKAEGFIGRKWLSTVNMNWEQFNKIFSEEKKIIYKPQADFGGEGVKVFNCDNKETLRKAYSEIEKLPFGVIESFVNQHPDMQQFSKKSVNTLRIVTIRTNNPEKGIETGKIHFIYGAMRMGSDDSYTDNLSSGGLMALIDIDTGILTTPGTDYSNRICYSHPITGAKIKGFHVPFFKEAKQIIIDFSEKYDIEGYYGWDIAITENGAILIEGNNAPGMELLQLPYVLEKKGMKHILDPYL